MRSPLLTLCLLPSWALASEMPENAESFDRGEVTDRETKTLEEWMEEHGEALPPKPQRLPPTPPEVPSPPPPPVEETAPPPQPVEAPIPPPPGENASVPPTGEEFSGDLQPFTVTLVDKTLVQDANYAVTGCAPNQFTALLDNGIAPDTREGDGEYTAMSTLCPFGGTPVAIFDGDTSLWEENYQLPDNASAPSLRILRTTQGISIDAVSGISPPPSTSSPAPPPPMEPDESEPKGLSGAIWLLIGALLGYGFRSLQSGFKSKRKPSLKSVPHPESRQVHPATPITHDSPISLGDNLLAQTQKPASLVVDERLVQRTLTLSLAKHFEKEGRVLLLPHPKNQAFYPKLIPKTSDVIWFRGDPPRLQELREALSDPNSPIVCVLIEGLNALDTRKQSMESVAEQLKSCAAKRLVFIQLKQEAPVFEPSKWSLVQDHHWEMDE